MSWGSWQPTRFERFERVLDTSTRAAIIMTDAGRAYVKALGNPEGPHALAAEVVGTRLAEFLGLPTLDAALLDLDARVDEIPLDADPVRSLGQASMAQSGPAFVTRAIDAQPWSGDPERLASIVNPRDVAGLVVVDTWLANVDRYPPRPQREGETRGPHYDNVLLERVADGKRAASRLIAMDFTACLHRRGGELRAATYPLDLIREERVYGLFPEFEEFVTAEAVEPFLQRLASIADGPQHLGEVVSGIPQAWGVDRPRRDPLVEFLQRRADYLVQEFVANLAAVKVP